MVLVYSGSLAPPPPPPPDGSWPCSGFLRDIRLKLAWDWNWRGEGGRSRAVITAYNFNLKNPMSVVRLLICSAMYNSPYLL